MILMMFLLLPCRMVYAVNLSDPNVVWEITQRLLSGQPASLEEQLGVAAPTLGYSVYGDDTGYILIGDSRMTALNATCQVNATLDNWFVVGCAGAHLKYLTDTAIPVAEIIESAHPEIRRWKYIINLGLTDLNKAGTYVDYLGKLAQTKEVYFACVGPTSETRTTKAYGMTNQRIASFNAMISSVPSIHTIDLYNYLLLSGYQTVDDGFHYSADTTKNIYYYLRETARTSS